MSTVLRRLDEWLFAAATPRALAVLRVVTGTYATLYLLVRAPAFVSLADRSPSAFEPVGPLAWMTGPLPDALVPPVFAAVVLAGVGYTAGRGFRVCGPGFAVGFLLVTTYRSSWGQLLWFDNLAALHLLVVGCSGCAADALVPGRARRERAGAGYGWPIRVTAVVTVLTYALAGIAKLRIGGIDWLDGSSLRGHVAYSAARLELLGATPSPFARPFVRSAAVVAPVAAITVLLELGAPLALAGRRVALLWSSAMWAVHLGIALTMFVVFPYPLLTAAFLPVLGPAALDRIGTRAR